MAKRSKRKRRGGLGGRAPNPPDRPDPSATPAIEMPWVSGEGAEQARRGQVLIARSMLLACPVFEAVERGGDVVVDTGPLPPLLCPGCGMTTELARLSDCPHRLSQGQVLKLMLPPEVLHAEAEA